MFWLHSRLLPIILLWLCYNIVTVVMCPTCICVYGVMNLHISLHHNLVNRVPQDFATALQLLMRGSILRIAVNLTLLYSQHIHHSSIRASAWLPEAVQGWCHIALNTVVSWRSSQAVSSPEFSPFFIESKAIITVLTAVMVFGVLVFDDTMQEMTETTVLYIHVQRRDLLLQLCGFH